MAKHSSKWPRIEHGAQGRYLTALDLVPLRDKSRSRRGIRDHIVQHTDIIAISDTFLTSMRWISEVAFSKAFKRYFGIAPGAYRQGSRSPVDTRLPVGTR